MATRTRFSTLEPPRRVLLVRLGALGDVVRTLGALRLIRRTWPDASIAWAVEESASPLLLAHPDLDNVFVLPRKELQRRARRAPWTGWSLVSSFVRRLREYRADLAIDFQGSFKSGLVMRLSGSTVRVGFAAPFSREFSHVFATVRADLPAGSEHRVLRAIRLAEAAGATPGPAEIDLVLTAAELDVGRQRVSQLAGSQPLVALAPWSSRRQAWKRYPAERWAEVARGVSARGARVAILGGPGEEKETAQLCAAAGPGVFPSGDLGVRELAAFIAACTLFVGGDTGPMHIAWAVGRPVVAIYGPTDPTLNAPFGVGHTVLASAHPTGRHDSDPFPGITPERIVAAASPYLPQPVLENQR